MQEQERRALRELIAKATDGDGTAATAIEDMIMAFDRAERSEDVAAALEQLATFAPPELYHTVVTRLQANDHSGRQQWPMIG